MSAHATAAKIRRFHALHEACFVIPNPWNEGTARYLEQLGFAALATSSGGFAFERALPDAQWAVSRDLMLQHIRAMVQATSLPVSADFESGYAIDPEGVAANVALCVETGVAGLSIEDASDDRARPLFEATLAKERIRAARQAIDESGSAVLLTGRCEAFLKGVAQPFETALARLQAYAEAGADCLFAPGVRDPEQIRLLVQAVAPKPLNVIVTGAQPDLTVARLAELGVRRISQGSALARIAWAAFADAAREMREQGTFSALSGALPYGELNGLFAQPRG